MAFDFSTLVTDRTQQDVAYARQLAEKLVTGTATEAEIAEWNSFTLKGVYNHTDLNRVTAAMNALKAKLEGYGYAVPGYQRIKVPHVLPEPKPTNRLPEGYLELTHIEATGTQYIDTKFSPNQDTRVICKAQYTDISGSFCLFGARYSVNERRYDFLVTGNRFYSEYNNNSGSYPTLSATTDVLEIDKNKNVTTVNGVTHSSHNYVAFQTPCNMLLFAENTNNSPHLQAKAKIYSFQIYDNGTLIRDYIPCINPDGAVGLYDLVTAAFFGNSGTGSFVAGAIPRKLPEGYTQVEYIQSSGTQYINTGFKPSNNTHIIMDAQATATGTYVYWGARTGSLSKTFCCFAFAASVRSDYGTTQKNISTSKTTSRVTVEQNKNVCTHGGLAVSHDAQVFQCDFPLYLLAANSNGTVEYASMPAKLYSCQIYDNGMLIRDFVPCINPSGEIGLYDIANDVFYQNAGSGTFAAGEEVVAPAIASVTVVSDDDVTEYDPYTWYEFDWPTPKTMTIYLLNVSAIRAVIDMLPTTPKTPADMELLTWAEANDIEQILFDVETVIYQVVNGFPCSDAFTFWSGHRPFPSATSDKGRTWEELDAMNTTWGNWQVANWYLLLYGNLRAEGVID